MFKQEKPPNWDKLVELYDVEWGTVAVTYAPHIYRAIPLSPDLEVHENVHIRQQGNDPDAWWEKYYVDKEFRLSQEVEAYRAQIEFLKPYMTDPNHIHNIRVDVAKDLSGKMYGKLASFRECMRLLEGQESLVHGG